MRIMGVESSCDETSVAVVENGRDVLYFSVVSSVDFHKRYGGVIPEIASRKHLEFFSPMLEGLIKELDISSIDLIAVCNRPGLIPSLLVGLSFAKAISIACDIPLVAVDHIFSHIYAVMLDSRLKLDFPFVGLVASGGHTSLFLVEGWSYDKVRLLGKTKDDACGEAFDKAAKLLGLGYPGGPVIEKRAEEGCPVYEFKCYKGKDYDFSFSGVKTSLLYFLRKQEKISEEMINDICASYQKSIIDVLVEKTVRAAKEFDAKAIVVGGGVAVNKFLRKMFEQVCACEGIPVFFPERRFCGDNAAMVAGLGYYLWDGEKLKDTISMEALSYSLFGGGR